MIKLKKIVYNLFLIYLVIIPLIDQLKYKIYGKVGLDNILLLLVFGLFIIYVIGSKIKPQLNRFAMILMLIYITASFLPTLSSYVFGGSTGPRQLTMGLRFGQMIMIILMVHVFVEDWADLRNISMAYLAGAVIAALIGVGQAMNIDLLWDVVKKHYIIGEQHVGTFIRREKIPSLLGENANTFGAYMSMSLIYLLCTGSRMFKKSVEYALAFLIFVGLILSLSVTSIISFVAGFSVLTAITLKKGAGISRYLKYMGIMVIGCLIVYTFNSKRIHKRIKKKLIVAQADRTAEKPTVLNIYKVRGMHSRYKTWNRYMESVKNRNIFSLLLGTGYERSGIADNYYIELLSAGGIISLVLFVLLLGSLYYRELKAIFPGGRSPDRSEELNITAVSLLAAMSVMCLTASYLGYLVAAVPVIIVVAGTGRLSGKQS